MGKFNRRFTEIPQRSNQINTKFVKPNGADALALTLADAGVETIFCITGAGNLAIIDAVARLGKTRFIYSHHEQAAVMEAQGYSRVSGKLGVALVTTGGGAANSVTGVLSAHLDSVPILLITGNESSFHCNNEFGLRAYGVQGFDAVSVLKPITKLSDRITDVKEVTSKTKLSISTAMRDRKGPTHIDFPMDLQRQQFDTQSEDLVIFHDIKSDQSDIRKFVDLVIQNLLNSKKPLIYIGNGFRHGRGYKRFIELAEHHQIPIIVSWSAIDLLPEDHALNVGRVGIYGDRAANILLQQSDFLLCIGTRLAIPQVGYDKKDFARNATKWIVDIDPSETAKFSNLGWNTLCLSADDFVASLLLNLKDSKNRIKDFSGWLQKIKNVKESLPRNEQIGVKPSDDSNFVHSADVIFALNELNKQNAIVVTDVGAGLLSGHYAFSANGHNRLITSQGLGEMGFGLPCAIGAYFADPSKQIICLNTDGAIMFNLQELQLIKEYGIPIKLFVFNNGGYGMIKISQENLFQSGLQGSTSQTGISFPSFKDIAHTFGLKYVAVGGSIDVHSALKGDLNSSEAILFDIKMDPDQKYLPRLATEKLKDGTFISPPIEDLEPKISLNELEEHLGYKASESSIKARN
jgi:acetolactate synthase I/II/III large subunit